MGYDWDTLEGRYRIRLAERIITDAMPDLKDKTVLDVGCRVGNFSRYMQDRGAIVHGIDSDREAVNQCLNNTRDGAIVTCGDATTFNSGKHYDLVFVKDVIEHIWGTHKLIENMRCHQDAGGKIIIGTHNSLSLTYIIDGLYSFLAGNVWRGYDPDHKHFFNHRKLNRILRAHDYEPQCYYGTYHWPYRSVNKKLVGRYGDSEIYHLIDRTGLNSLWPFSVTGWWIGVIAEAV